MLIALIADVHANLPALEAVLDAIRPRHPDRIISLGDQVNLGPCPRETLRLLRENGVDCLHGNHERYVFSALRGDPAFAGANFESLRWNAAQLGEEDLIWPESIRIEDSVFCHAVPGDDRFPVFDASQAVPRLRALYTEGFVRIFCGHGHNPTTISLPHVHLQSIGAVGCMDDGLPGCAPYVMLELTHGGAFARPYSAAYDVRRIPSLFLSSGMADFCPVMAHICCLQMTLNRDFLVSYVTQARSVSVARGEQTMSRESWHAVDRSFAWPDGLDTAAFWRAHRA